MKNNRKIKAFSLIELSIVIVIISILLTGALSVSITSVNNAKIKLTNDRIDAVYKALGTYLLINKMLPCPAPMNLDRNNAGYGTSNTGASCTTTAGVYLSTTAGATNLIYGAVPTKTLELPSEFAEDGFGSKIAYILHKDFTTTITATTGGHVVTSPYNPASPIIQIKENPAALVTTQYAILALVSYGANKSGAFGANSTSQNTVSTDTDELDNSPGTITGTGATFDNTLISVSNNSDLFDDIVFAKTRTQMINDFNALPVIRCTTPGAAFTATSADYDQVIYATSACAAPNDSRRLTKKCTAFGVWIDIVASCT
jgi:prepilin-type N-terminal cleavage/methylation domain-containing protein